MGKEFEKYKVTNDVPVLKKIRLGKGSTVWLRKSLRIFFFFSLFNNLFYILTTVFPTSSSPSQSPSMTLFLLDSPICSSSFHIWIPWTSIKQRYQVVVRISTSPCIKVGQGNTVWEIKSQKPIKKSESVPGLTIRSPPKSPSYRTVTYAESIEQSQAGTLVISSVSVSSYALKLIGSVGFLVTALTSLASTIFSMILPGWPVGFCIPFFQLLDETSLMSIGLRTNLCVKQNIFRHNYINIFYSIKNWFYLSL